MASSTSSSNLPRLSKSRLPIPSNPLNTGAQLARHDQQTAVVNPSPRLATSTSTPRVPKSPVTRPHTTTTSSKPSQPFSTQATPERPRTKSVPKPPPRFRTNEPEQAIPSTTPAMTMKEAIALKRVEAKKATTAQRIPSEHDGSSGGGIDGTSPNTWRVDTVDDDLGRLSVRETIERARSSGSLNLASRDLPCLPSALFEIHLSVTPEKLSSVLDEPILPEKPGKKSKTDPPTWYDQQDLTFLRARNNQIVEIQPEICLFGSLKTIDLQRNRLVSLPDSFADLASLVNLDLSHNALSFLPPHIYSLPVLSLLDISHNTFTALPFNMPFDPAMSTPAPSRRSNSFFSPPEIVRATCPLPSLTSLRASHNKIASSAIHCNVLPQNLGTFDLAYNPLGDVTGLLMSLSELTQLVDLRMSRCNIDDTSFPTSLLTPANKPTFPKLAVLDLEETRVTQAAVSKALSCLNQTIDFEVAITDARTVPKDTLAVTVGKRIVREDWEIEADRHVQRLREKRSAVNLRGTPTPALPPLPQPVAKEKAEADAEQGSVPEDSRFHEQAETTDLIAHDARADVSTTNPPPTAPGLERYWDPRTLTLTLPPSPGRPIRHTASSAATEEERLPRATLPLTLIMAQSFADTLRTLDLRGRRAEPAFILSVYNGQPLLPQLETLNLEGCALSDSIPGADATHGGTLGVLVQLFPSLRNLELGYNNFTGALVERGILERLLFAGKGGCVGLRRLGLCGNRIEELHGLRELAQMVFGSEAANEDGELRTKWTLEELDVRENSIAGLPGELGLLPLDLFVVDGNLFRVPPRRVWEREGTKGLLAWLRGRLET